MLVTRNINVFFGKAHVLKDISIKVGAGEIVAVVGSNGAGKTTLLNTISRFLTQKSGEISFQGVSLDRLPYSSVVQMGIAHVPEGRMIAGSLSVKENLELGAFQKRARKRKQQTLMEVYQLFPRLEQRKHQAAGTLSGGEQQMLAIGRGLMSLPELLMLDEPSLGLAPVVVQAMFDIIKKINGAGVSILLVEQNVGKALKFCDRGYVIENGGVTLEGRGDSLLENDRMKKAFLGL